MKDYIIYVTEDIANKAMENGFKCKRVYENRFFGTNHDEFIVIDFSSSPASALIYKLPAAEQICGWLREEKGIIISISNRLNGDYDYYGYACSKDKPEYGKTNCGNDYNEVMLEIINKAFELL